MIGYHCRAGDGGDPTLPRPGTREGISALIVNVIQLDSVFTVTQIKPIRHDRHKPATVEFIGLPELDGQ